MLDSRAQRIIDGAVVVAAPPTMGGMQDRDGDHLSQRCGSRQPYLREKSPW
jgi:hypothetical protein